MAKVYQYKVLVGKHAEAQPDGTSITYGKGEPAGDTFETSRPLDTIFNSLGCEKFQKISEREVAGDVPAAAPLTVTPSAEAPKRQVPDTLDSMSIDELKKFAAEEEIDLTGASKKSEILEVIRKAFGV